MSSSIIPTKCCVAVIGGGPAGSTAAILLAREGVDVVLLEKERFPRYHIGESLLLSARHIFELLGIEQKVADCGFVKKYGAYFKVKHGSKPGHIDFRRNSGPYNHSYQVLRSQFDKLLLDHAAEQGAKVFEETRVGDIQMEGERPVALQWTRQDGQQGRLEFDFLVDASGLSGLLATRYLKNRVYQENFANVAVGRYYRGHRPYRQDEPGAFFAEALTNSSGWTWYIPLHNGTVSVGVVVHRDEFARMKHACDGDLIRTFDAALKFNPEISELLADAAPVGETHVWQDYSYVAEKFAGPNYRLVGDAAGFIDPFFSTGVHMAFLGGLFAAATICSSRKGEVDEATAGTFHDRCVRRAYTRFVLAVSGVYVQIRNQSKVVLHGIANEDLQLAFNMIQPVVSGVADSIRTPVSQETLAKAMKYVGDAVLESHGVDSQNSISKLISGIGMESFESNMLAESGSGAISNLYIRTQPGRLGLARTSWWQSFGNRLTSKVYGFFVRQVMPEVRSRGNAPIQRDAVIHPVIPAVANQPESPLASESRRKPHADVEQHTDAGVT